jgi:hypothetical protein
VVFPSATAAALAAMSMQEELRFSPGAGVSDLQEAARELAGTARVEGEE